MRFSLPNTPGNAMNRKVVWYASQFPSSYVIQDINTNIKQYWYLLCEGPPLHVSEEDTTILPQHMQEYVETIPFKLHVAWWQTLTHNLLTLRSKVPSSAKPEPLANTSLETANLANPQSASELVKVFVLPGVAQKDKAQIAEVVPVQLSCKCTLFKIVVGCITFDLCNKERFLNFFCNQWHAHKNNVSGHPTLKHSAWIAHCVICMNNPYFGNHHRHWMRVQALDQIVRIKGDLRAYCSLQVDWLCIATKLAENVLWCMIFSAQVYSFTAQLCVILGKFTREKHSLLVQGVQQLFKMTCTSFQHLLWPAGLVDIPGPWYV